MKMTDKLNQKNLSKVTDIMNQREYYFWRKNLGINLLDDKIVVSFLVVWCVLMSSD